MARVRVTAKDENGKVLGEHYTSEDGAHTPVDGPTDLAGQLAPWVIRGVVGELTAQRSGVLTLDAPELWTAAAQLAVAVGCGESPTPELVAAMVGDGRADQVDTRVYYGTSLPGPVELVRQLAPVRMWPLLMLAPIHVRCAVGYWSDETGRSCVVVMSTRHIPTRKPRAA